MSVHKNTATCNLVGHFIRVLRVLEHIENVLTQGVSQFSWQKKDDLQIFLSVQLDLV